MIEVFIPSLVMLAVAILSAAFDPRKVRIGVYLLSAIVFASVPALALIMQAASNIFPGDQGAVWVLLAVMAAALLGITAVGVLLVASGVEVVRREGRSLAHLLALVTGVAVLTYLAAAVVYVMTSNQDMFALIFVLGLPLGYIGFGLIAYLLWSRLYGFLARHLGRPVSMQSWCWVRGWCVGACLRCSPTVSTRESRGPIGRWRVGKSRR